MPQDELAVLLRSKVPARLVFADVERTLSEGSFRVELDQHWISVSWPTPLEIVGRSYHDSEYEAPFGRYRAVVAIGGVVSREHGILVAGTCFATLYYTDEIGLLSVDFFASWA